MGSTLKVLVYGWYGHSNIGDELFKDAFKHLFPKYDFVFTDRITQDLLKDISVVFIGGGSFLDSKLIINDDALPILLAKNIFYIGVGTETNIHPTHLQIMKIAKLIATRSTNLEKVKEINGNSICIPDIVYSLRSKINIKKKKEKTILILPNVLVVPDNGSANWKHASWNYFKSEFAQSLDCLIEEKYHINFFSMCNSDSVNDNFAAIEIINMMKHKSNKNIITHNSYNITNIIELFSQYKLIITQRFHGIVLAELAEVPYIAIHHHDKLKSITSEKGLHTSYYGLYKQNLLEQINIAINFNTMPIEDNIFDMLSQNVNNLINGG